MELSILTNCKMIIAILDQDDLKMTYYKSFKDDSEFARKDINVIECFNDEDVSIFVLFIFFSLTFCLVTTARATARTK